MADSLLDMFQPRSLADNTPIGFGDALAQNRQSLVGLGMGLLTPRSMAVGAPAQSAWSNALGGYEQGAAQDARQANVQAQLAHQKRQEARQAAQDAFNRQMAEKQFAQSTLTPYQKMQSDLAAAKGTPNEQTVMDFYRNQLDAGPPQTREIFDPTLGRNVIQEWDSRSRQYKTATQGGGTTAAAPAAPADPFTAGAAPQPVYGQSGNYSTPAAAATPAAPAATGGSAGPQPLLPAKKPLTAHEQTAIDEADKAVMANQNAIANLQYAKQLSPKAASGWFALERGKAGAQLGGMFGEGGKETVMLHNTIINNAVDQLKATFGGNPSEGERKILLEMAGSVNEPDAVRQEIYNRGIDLAKQKLAYNQKRAQEIRGGTYYNPGSGVPAPTTQAQPASGAPRPGFVKDGYVFKGGEPSDPNNWASVR